MEAVKNRIAMACDPIFLLPDYAIYIADRKSWKPWKTMHQILLEPTALLSYALHLQSSVRYRTRYDYVVTAAAPATVPVLR